jgi:FKBP-type peptidyl-prolyl cis-trans isomerase 2
MKRDKTATQTPFRQLTRALVCLLIFSGCATQGAQRVLQPDHAAGTPERHVLPGDRASVHYLCRLSTGEVVAATDNVPEEQPKSNIFVKQKDAGPQTVTATMPDELLSPKQEEPFEAEILHRLSGKVAGVKEGEKRLVQVAAPDVPTRDEQNYVVRLARVRTRPKQMKFTISEFRNRTHKEPEVGQSFAIDPSFPGTVEAVTEQDVVIRFFATPGDVLETPFGPGHIREEGQNYKVDIDARKGGLTRIGSMIGRIVDVDDKTITVDYRNPFGGETLLCDVTVEKISDAKLVQSESSDR